MVHDSGLAAEDGVFIGVYDGCKLCTHVIHMRPGVEGQGPAPAKQPCLELDYVMAVHRIHAAEIGNEKARAGIETLDVLGSEWLGEALSETLGVADQGTIGTADKLGPFFKMDGGGRYRLRVPR